MRELCMYDCTIVYIRVTVHLFSDRFLEADEGEDTSEFTQGDIAGVVDIASAQKVGWCG